MRALRAVFLLNGAALAVFYPFVSVILSGRGASTTEIGLVTAASATAFSLAVPAWGHVADVILGRRRALAAAAIGAAAFVLLAGAPLPLVLATVGFVGFSTFECSWGPLGDALAVNAIRDHGREYGRIRMLSSAAFAVTASLAGLAYDATGYGPSFVLCAGLAVLLAAAALFVPDVARADLSRMAGDRSRGGSFGAALRIQPRLRLVLLALLLVHVGIIAGFTFLPLRILELGGGPSDVALVAAASAFAEIPAMLVAGPIAMRIGLRWLVVGSMLVYAATFAAWVVLDSPALIIATRIPSGFAFAALWVGSVLTMATLLPPQLQATGQGLYQLTGFGIAAVVADVGGGLVYGAFGAGAVFGIATVLALIAGAVAAVAFPRAGEQVAREEDFGRPLPFPATPG